MPCLRRTTRPWPARRLRARQRLQRTYGLLVGGVIAAGLMVGCAGPSAERRAGAVEEGLATYYAPRLAGHRTASGERYEPASLTAAHPVLPFGTRARVTRLDGAAPPVIVRINDRCAGGRKIIDLSMAAARRLDMLRAGIVRVRVEVLP
jgi:rare lipoprotein A